MTDVVIDISPRWPTLETFFLWHGMQRKEERVVQPFHKTIFTAIQQWVAGLLPDGKRNLAICMPPRYGKTYIARDLVSWGLALWPDSEWIYTSFSATLAVAQTVQIKNCVSSDFYTAMFPYVGVQPGKGRQDYFTTPAGGAVYGVGVGGTITGFGAGKKRQDFGGGIIIDDPLQAQDAYSVAMRERCNTWYTQTLYSRRNCDTTPVLLIMQRLHEADLVGYLLEHESALWHVIQIPVRNDAGEYLWPETFSETSAKMLEEIDPFAFSAQYMQWPTPPGGAMFREEWLQRYSRPPDSIHTRIVTMDTAMKTGEHNDFSVLAAWGFDGSDVYLLDVLRGKWTAPDLIGKAVAFLTKHRPRRPSTVRLRGVVIEDKASGTGLIQTLRRDPAMRDMPIIAMQRSRDKVSRANDILPFVRAGKLHLPESAPWLPAYIGELTAFSPAMTHEHDDQVDVTIDALDELLSKGGGMSRGMDLS